MKLIVEGNVKEIAELVRKMQERPNGKIVIDGKTLIREPYQQRYHVVNEVQEDQRLKQDKNSRM